MVVTNTGRIARLVAKYKPEVPILAYTKNAVVIKQLNVVRGV